MLVDKIRSNSLFCHLSFTFSTVKIFEMIQNPYNEIDTKGLEREIEREGFFGGLQELWLGGGHTKEAASHGALSIVRAGEMVE